MLSSHVVSAFRQRPAVVLAVVACLLPVPALSKPCVTDVTVALWTPKDVACDEICKTTKAQWISARSLFSDIGAKFVQYHVHDVQNRHYDELKQKGREFGTEKVGLTMHYPGDAVVVEVAAGAEVSLGLNRLCQSQLFPKHVENTIRLMQGMGSMPMKEAKRLARSANLDAWDPTGSGTAPLLGSVLAKEVPVIKWLVALGANQNTRDSVGQTALHLSVAGKGSEAPKSLEVATFLIDAGYSFEARNKLGETPLHLLLHEWPNTFFLDRTAKHNPFNHHLGLFLEKGASVHARDARDQVEGSGGGVS